MIREKDTTMVLLLTLFTCGLYSIFWLYDTAKQLKNQLNSSDNPDMDLLLSLLCFPYCYFWYYKICRQTNQAQINAGLPAADNSALILILIFCGLGLVANLIIQGQLNAIAQKNQQI